MPALMTSLYNNGYGKSQDKPDVAITTTNVGQDAFIVRYNTDGVALWSARIGSTATETAWAVTTDSKSNVIVAGQTGAGTGIYLFNSDGTSSGKIIPTAASNAAFIAKYHTSGKALWVARLDGAGVDVAYSVSTDSIGNIYVVGAQGNGAMTAYNEDGTAFGTTIPLRSGAEAFVVKYDSNGNVLWIAQIASSTAGSTEIGYGGAVDKTTGDVYVVGQAAGNPTVAYSSNGTAFGTTIVPSGSSDAFIVKYNTSGTVQWVARVVTPGADFSRLVATDGSGNVYVHGISSATTAQTNVAFNSNGTSFATTPAGLGATVGDSFIVKYNSTGFVQWLVLVGNQFNESAWGLAVDSSENVYITQDLQGGGNGDTWLRRLNGTTGATVWSARIDSDGADTAYGLTTDSSGNVYVGFRGGTNISPFQIRVRNTAGTAIFTFTVNSAALGGCLVKYNSSGTPLWVRRISNSNTLQLYGLAAGTMNDLYQVGTGTGGNLQVLKQQTSLFTTFANGGSNDGVVVKYDTNGNVQWATRISTNAFIYGIRTDGSENMYVTGHTNLGYTTTFYNADGSVFASVTSGFGFIVKYSKNGMIQWYATFSGIGYGVATDSSGNAYIIGQNQGGTFTAKNSDGTNFSPSLADGGLGDAIIVKYNSSGFVQWNARIESGNPDVGFGIATDSSGNVYVTGQSGTGSITRFRNANDTTFASLTNLGGTDTFVAKYNTNGTVQWIARISSTADDIGYSIATDSSGNVYITGQGGTGATVSAYPGGNGTGASWGSIVNAGGTDVFIVKYNTNGTGQWITRIAGTGADIGYGITADAFGNIYVVGNYVSAVTAYSVGNVAFPTTLAAVGSGDGFIVKYDSSGTVQWVARIGSGIADTAFSARADRSGNLYVVGQFGPTATNTTVYNSDTTIFANPYESCAVIKYDPNGMVEWIQVIRGTTTGATLRSVDVDIFRNVYVGGWGPVQQLTIYSSDYTPYEILQSQRGTQEGFVIKYSNLGTPQWASVISTTGSDLIFSVATDSSGNIYAVGQYGTGAPGPINLFNGDGTRFTPTLTNAGGVDGIVLKYNSSGTIQWRARISGTSNEFGLGVATDSSGNVYVTGQIGNSTTTTFVNSDDTTTAAVLTSGGAADAYIAKYDTNGTVLWRIKIASTTGDAGWSIAIDSSGNVYATGTAGATGGSPGFFDTSDVSVATITNTGAGDAYVVKYDTNGVFQWVSKLGSTAADFGYGIATDSSGNVFVTGVQGGGTLTATNSDGTTFPTTLTTTSGQDTFIVKFNTNGITQWLTRIGNLGSSSDIGRSITIDPSGNVIVGGSYFGNATANVYAANGTTVWATITSSLGGNVDAFVIKYDTDGNPQWVARIATTSSTLETVYAVTTDTAGNIYAAGYGIASTPIWAYNGGVGSAGMTIFGSLTTTSKTPGTNTYLVKYNSSGQVQWITGFVGGSGNNEPRDLATDSSGNLIMCGGFTESAIVPESSAPT